MLAPLTKAVTLGYCFTSREDVHSFTEDPTSPTDPGPTFTWASSTGEPWMFRSERQRARDADRILALPFTISWVKISF